MVVYREHRRPDGLIISYPTGSVGMRWLKVSRRGGNLDAADVAACYAACPETYTVDGREGQRGTLAGWVQGRSTTPAVRMPGDGETIERLLREVPMGTIPDTPIDPTTAQALARALAQVADKLETAMVTRAEQGGDSLTAEGAVSLVLSALRGAIDRPIDPPHQGNP